MEGVGSSSRPVPFQPRRFVFRLSRLAILLTTTLKSLNQRGIRKMEKVRMELTGLLPAPSFSGPVRRAPFSSFSSYLFFFFFLLSISPSRNSLSLSHSLLDLGRNTPWSPLDFFLSLFFASCRPKWPFFSPSLLSIFPHSFSLSL